MSDKTLRKKFRSGTKILLFTKAGIVVTKSEVATIASLTKYNNDLYEVTFKEPHLKGSAYFDEEDLIKRRWAYEDSLKAEVNN